MYNKSTGLRLGQQECTEECKLITMCEKHCARNTVALLVFLCSFLLPKIIRYYLGEMPQGISESILC